MPSIGAYSASGLNLTPDSCSLPFSTHRALHSCTSPWFSRNLVRKFHNYLMMRGALLRSAYVHVFLYIIALSSLSIALVHSCDWHANLKFSGTKMSCADLDDVDNLVFSEIMDSIQNEICALASFGLENVLERASIEAWRDIPFQSVDNSRIFSPFYAMKSGRRMEFTCWT